MKSYEKHRRAKPLSSTNASPLEVKNKNKVWTKFTYFGNDIKILKSLKILE
jgi:hypothetical protein